VKTQHIKTDKLKYLDTNKNHVMLIWLPLHGFQQPEAASKNVAYIPERVFSDPSYCYCGLLKASPEDAKCFFCGHPIMKLIEESVKDGKIAPQLL